MLVLAALSALAGPIEEVVVFADPLQAWDGTRWSVGIETLAPEAPLEIEQSRLAVRAPGWQIAAVMVCRVAERRARGGVVTCQPEDVALRLVTAADWMRPEDRARVERVVRDTRDAILDGTVTLRVRDHGDLEVMPSSQRDT
ncbi:MAG: hypothetical protein KC656_03420, partial [Myxococcales bacterium]|nr:hypothetical protein [Myxococcales bacterium]